MKKASKREALQVSRLIHEVLVGQLNIPLRQIVNDSTFSKWTGSMRPDVLISEFEFDGSNDNQFISNLVAYAEVKDNCSVNDVDWKNALQQASEKSIKLGLPYFIITNCKTSVFYNTATKQEITLNKNPIREFQAIDILRLIKNRLSFEPMLGNIQTNVDSISTISEAIFNKKLWELQTLYRGINFKDNLQKIDFTIGFVALEFYEEKEILDNSLDHEKIYWSNCLDANDEKMVGNINAYIHRLAKETSFKEFKDFIEQVRLAIIGDGENPPLITKQDTRSIYEVIDSMRPLHGTGFDLFGAVYEMFASSKEKKDFGEYFTRRHYAHLLAKLLLNNEKVFSQERPFSILDPACGTGGFLTEAFKVLKNNYESSGTFDAIAKTFLSYECLYGVDVRNENIARTKLNMFLVGDGHTNMECANSLRSDEYPFTISEFDYILTNPPYGTGTIRAETSALSTLRTEVAFLCKIRQLLRVGGRACVIQPDGVLENPSFMKIRKELLETCDVTAIISLPDFAFAPYTKEKTYALFLTKRSKKNTRIQKAPVWMYIIDNDGLANSDKRFPTKLRNNRNGWMHDEISGWVTTDGEEKPGILEDRWMSYDDKANDGTTWIDERGQNVKKRKAGNVQIDTILSDKYFTLLPELYLRGKRNRKPEGSDFEYVEYQARDVAASEIFSVIGGNSGLTEEYIYSLLLHQGERKYRLLTGSADVNNALYIHRCEHPKDARKLIRVFSGNAIHVIRKGKAGFATYMPEGNYTLSDDAYLLVEKNNSGYQVSLEWMVMTQQDIFKEHSTKSANGTWSKTGFLKYAVFDIPAYEEQLLVVQHIKDTACLTIED
ncbi:MAG: HsdM family class I SAM-dependent methyltransferase [Armatimonadota bacterium]